MAGPGDSLSDGAYVILKAAADNSRQSRVPNYAKHVEVTARVTDANDWIILPTGIPIGYTLTGYSAVAHEIRTEPSSNIKINDVDSDGSQEAAITATWNWEAIYLGSTGWVLKAWTKLAAPTTAIIPD